jgi:hypothetical protein
MIAGTIKREAIIRERIGSFFGNNEFRAARIWGGTDVRVGSQGLQICVLVVTVLVVKVYVSASSFSSTYLAHSLNTKTARS